MNTLIIVTILSYLVLGILIGIPMAIFSIPVWHSQKRSIFSFFLFPGATVFDDVGLGCARHWMRDFPDITTCNFTGEYGVLARRQYVLMHVIIWLPRIAVNSVLMLVAPAFLAVVGTLYFLLSVVPSYLARLSLRFNLFRSLLK